MKPLIAHVGGIFIYSENPKELAEWYTKHLGIQYEYTSEYKAYYASFFYLEPESKQKRYLAWSINHTDKRPTYKEGKVFTVNYRVHNLDDTLAHLRSLNVPIKGQEDHEEGRFAWIDDPEGNTIELWQE